MTISAFHPPSSCLPALRALTRNAACLAARAGKLTAGCKGGDSRSAARDAVRDCLDMLETAMGRAHMALKALDNDSGPDIARNYSACERLRQSITKARSDALALLAYLQMAP